MNLRHFSWIETLFPISLYPFRSFVLWWLNRNLLLLYAMFQEQAIDIILTLGQAFELAYQMALRDQVTSKSKANRDNHKPAVSPGAVSSNSSSRQDFKDADVKLNGHPLKMKPLTLSIAVESSNSAPQDQKTPTKG